MTLANDTWQATGGAYDMMFNAQEGAIMAIHRVSPSIAAKKPQGMAGVAPGKFPNLSRVSDVIWLEWAHLAGDQVQKLRYIISVEIANSATNNLIAWIIAQNPYDATDVPEWANRITFDPATTADGKRLLGSPNLLGFTYMIYQHKQQLGNKKVKSISIFKGDPIRAAPPRPRAPAESDRPLFNIHLLMELADV